jgi:hypothetical protein
MPHVFIVNRGAHDFSDAKRFGEIIYLSEGDINKYSVNKMYRIFATRLRRSQPEDYILVSGLTVMACIACACFAFLHHKLNVLLFKNGRYIERRLILDNLLDYNKESQDKQISEITKEGE